MSIVIQPKPETPEELLARAGPPLESEREIIEALYGNDAEKRRTTLQSFVVLGEKIGPHSTRAVGSLLKRTKDAQTQQLCITALHALYPLAKSKLEFSEIERLMAYCQSKCPLSDLEELLKNTASQEQDSKRRLYCFNLLATRWFDNIDERPRILELFSHEIKFGSKLSAAHAKKIKKALPRL